jgi:hypothetical protein
VKLASGRLDTEFFCNGKPALKDVIVCAYYIYDQGRLTVMGLGRIAEAGVITWFLGGGFLMFIIVLLLLKAC